MGFDVEAFLRGHFAALAVAAAALWGCLLVAARSHERARALAETAGAVARARSRCEQRRARGFDSPLLPRLEPLEARLRRLGAGGR